MPGMGSAWWTILKSVLRFDFRLMSFVQGFIYCSFLEFVCVNYLGRWLHLIFSCICCIFCPSSNLTNLSSSTTRRWVQDPANSKKKENAILDVSDTGWLFSACLVWKHFCMFLFWIFDSLKISSLFTFVMHYVYHTFLYKLDSAVSEDSDNNTGHEARPTGGGASPPRWRSWERAQRGLHQH